MGVNGNFHLVFDTAANTWTKKAPLRVRRANFALAAVAGKLYAIGGDVFSSVVEIFDPLKDAWTPGANMPTKRQHIDCAVVNGKIYVMGGLESWTKLSAKNEAYDPSTDTWESKAPIPTPRHNPVVAELDGKIFVIGGGGDSADIWNDTLAVEVYDPAANTWEQLPALPSSRFYAAGTSIGGKVVIAGGYEIRTDVSTASLDAYDPVLKIWRKIGELPQTMAGGYLVLMDDRLYALGGVGLNSSNIMQVYYSHIFPHTGKMSMAWAINSGGCLTFRVKNLVIRGGAIHVRNVLDGRKC